MVVGTLVLDVLLGAEISAAVVASTHGHAHDVLTECERFVVGRPEVELLSARIRVLDDEDMD